MPGLDGGGWCCRQPTCLISCPPSIANCICRHSAHATLASAVDLWSSSQQRAVLAHWRAAAVRRCQLRVAANAVMARMMHCSLAAAWSAWCDYCAEQQHKLGVLEAAVAHWQMCHLRIGLEAFADNSARMQRARAVVARVCERRLSAAFTSWRQVLAAHANAAATLVSIAARFNAPLLAEACSEWRAAVVEAQERRQLMAAAVAHWSSRAMASALCTWRYQVSGREE